MGQGRRVKSRHAGQVISLQPNVPQIFVSQESSFSDLRYGRGTELDTS